jgi:hypothetical protein
MKASPTVNIGRQPDADAWLHTLRPGTNFFLESFYEVKDAELRALRLGRERGMVHNLIKMRPLLEDNQNGMWW